MADCALRLRLRRLRPDRVAVTVRPCIECARRSVVLSSSLCFTLSSVPCFLIRVRLVLLMMLWMIAARQTPEKLL